MEKLLKTCDLQWKCRNIEVQMIKACAGSALREESHILLVMHTTLPKWAHYQE